MPYSFKTILLPTFLVETTLVAFFRGNEEDLRTTKMHFWHVFLVELVHLSVPFLTSKLGKV